MRVIDVFGMPRKTWQSYHQFKSWFDHRCMTVPGLYINATEGGTLGAYPEGNVDQILQKSLKEVIQMYSLSEEVRANFETVTEERKILF